jgi:aspartate-semialdehyde dehydrogenase
VERQVRLGLAGASGALGQQIVDVLGDAPWHPERFVPMARASSEVGTVSFRGQDVAVDALEHAAWEDLDLLVVALPAAVAGPVVAAAAAAGVSVVDCSGASLSDLTVPLVVPWLNGDQLDAPRVKEVIAVPSAAGVLLGTVIGALTRGGWRGEASATVLLPASAWGKAGIDELSKQVVALFNSGTPPRRVFEAGLAFDLLPLVGTPGATGWTDTELRVTAEVARLTGARCDVTLVAVPVFSGIGATLRVSIPSEWTPERLVQALADAGVEVSDGAGARRIPRPRKVDGSNSPHAARVRASIAGDALHLWLAMDNLRATAAAAVGVAGRLAASREASA